MAGTRSDNFATTGLSVALALAVGLVLVVALIALCLSRVPWADEFFTFYVAQPRFGWAEGLRDHWMTDNHPPLYYALVRATHWLGDTVAHRRLVNVMVLLGAGAALAILAALHPRWRQTIALYAIGLAALPTPIFYGSELRSNFLAFAGAAVAYPAMTVLTDGLPSWRRNLALLGILTLAFNTHYVSTVFVGAVAIGFVAKLYRERRVQAANALLLTCAVAALPLLVTLAAQAGNIARNTEEFWIAPGMNAARWAFEAQVQRMALANLVLTVAGVCGVFLLLRDTLRTRQVAPPSASILTLGLSVVFASAALILVHVWKPIVITRYLVALDPAALLCLAIGANRCLSALHARIPHLARGLLLGMAAVSLASLHANWRAAATAPNWGGTALLIARIHRACPGTLVHADLTWNRLELPPADKPGALRMAYAMTADQFGFPLEPQLSRRVARICPTVFWSEHVHEVQVSASDIAASLQARGFALGRLHMQRSGHGWIAVSQPR